MKYTLNSEPPRGAFREPGIPMRSLSVLKPGAKLPLSTKENGNGLFHGKTNSNFKLSPLKPRRASQMEMYKTRSNLNFTMYTGADSVLTNYRSPLGDNDLSPFSLKKYGINNTVHRLDPVHNRMISLPTQVPKKTDDLISVIALSQVTPQASPLRLRERGSDLKLPGSKVEILRSEKRTMVEKRVSFPAFQNPNETFQNPRNEALHNPKSEAFEIISQKV